jgi:transposase InsO family protein
LKGPAKWTCFHLYVILDIFSRHVVGWLIAHRESAELAEQLIADTVEKDNIAPGTLTLHADRGTSMRSKPVTVRQQDDRQAVIASGLLGSESVVTTGFGRLADGSRVEVASAQQATQGAGDSPRQT